MKMPEPLNPPAPMKPTVGRIVHFHLGGTKPPADPARGPFKFAPEQDTYAALVAAVASDGFYVNLTVSDFYGNTFSRTMIPFVQPGDERPAGAWCEWPPIQNAGRAPLMPPIGEPPTLNTPADREQASRRAEEKHANDLVEANVAAIRAEKERIRHPVIGAAQELDNNGAVINGTTSTETTDNGERRFAALDQVVESVKAHNANVPPEVIEREIDEAVTAVRAGHPVDDPGTGPFDSPAPPVSITDNLPSFSGSLHGMAKQSHNFDGITDDGGNSLPHIPQD